MNNRKVAFRVDASFKIGLGHIMRCQILASELKGRGFQCYFFCRHMTPKFKKNLLNEGHQINIINNGKKEKYDQNNLYESWLECSQNSDFKQFSQKVTPKFELFFIDHYSLDIYWERLVRDYTKILIVIDDLASRKHECDYLIDQNLNEALDTRYEKLVNHDCQKLLGTEYVILNNEFAKLRCKKRKKKKVENILIFYGGADPTGETLRVVKILDKYFRYDIFWEKLFVVVGLLNQDADEIQSICKRLPRTSFYINTPSMPKLIKDSDVALCAGGTFTWERFCLGLPGYVTTIAENQVKIILYLTKRRLTHYVGHYTSINEQTIKGVISQIKDIDSLDLTVVKEMMDLVDGLGARRIINAILRQ